MKFRKTIAGLLILIMICPILAGCAGSQEPRAWGLDNSTVVIAMGPNSEPEAGFDPVYGWGAGEHVHEPLIQSTLTVTTMDLGIGYDLATDLAVSEDGLTWTAVIRDDVRFTDGKPLTARDVAFTYNTVKRESTVNDFTMLNRAEAVDDTTVVFHMNTPYAIWPYSMANVGVVPEHAWGPGYGQNPVGSGRYRLQQWDRGQQVILQANPDYYGEPPQIETVVILFMSEDAAFAAVRAGQVDLAYTAASWSEQTVEGYSLLSVQSADNRGINLPAVPFDGARGNDVTGDPAVRHAINIGLDRQQMVDHALYGYGSPAYSVCDNLPWFSEGTVVSHDFDAAVQLLEDAGWTTGLDGVREKAGLRAELNLLYPAGDSVRQTLAAELADQLRGLGFDASLEGVGWDVAYDRAQQQPLVWGWGAHTPMEVYNLYHTAADGLARYSPYANAAADALMDGALAETDLAASHALWQQAQELVSADTPWVWLVNVDHLYWVRDGLQVAEQKLHPHGHGWSVVNNVDRWSWA